MTYTIYIKKKLLFKWMYGHMSVEARGQLQVSSSETLSTLSEPGPLIGLVPTN